MARRLEPTCDHCHRALNWQYVDEFGPTCPECLAALGEALPEPELIPEEPEPVVYVRKRKPRVERDSVEYPPPDWIDAGPVLKEEA